MPEQAMSEEDAVLAANQEFYRTFAARDLAAMDALWATETHRSPASIRVGTRWSGARR